MRTYDHALYVSDKGEEFSFKVKRGVLRWGLIDIPEGRSPPLLPRGCQARHFNLVPANPQDPETCPKTVYVGDVNSNEWTTDIGDRIYIEGKEYIVWGKCPEYIPRGRTINRRS